MFASHRLPALVFASALLAAGGCGSNVAEGPDGSGAGGNGGATTSATTGGGGATGGGGMAPGPCDPLTPGLKASLDEAYANGGDLKGGLLLAVSTADCPAWVATKGDDMLTVNAPVRIGVTSEMLVGAALLSLVEDGLLSLDDTIDQWHPAIVDGDTLTLRHLLNHTSGLRDYNENQDFLDIATANPGHVWTPEELIQYALDAGQATPPGQDWDRKFVDFVLLGTVIEAVTAQAAHVAIRERVVDPLGLSGTFLGGHEGDVATLIPGYLANGSDVSQWVDSSFWWVGAAYVGTGTDLLALTRDLVTGDLLTEESRQQLVSLSAPTDWAGVTNGLGVLVDVSFGDVRIGQEGELPGYEVRNYFSRELDAAVVIIGTNDWPTFDLFIDAFDVIEASQNL